MGVNPHPGSLRFGRTGFAADFGSWMCAGKLTGLQFHFEPGVVGTNSDWAVETERVRSKRSVPHNGVVDKDPNLIAIHFCPKKVGVARTQQGQWHAAERLNVPVTVISAFCACMLTRVRFYRDDEPRLGCNAPHCVDQIASVLGAQLEAKLAAHLAGTEPCFFASRSKVGKARLDHLGGPVIHVSAHLGDVYGEEFSVAFFDGALCDAEIRASHLCHANVGRTTGCQNDSCDDNGDGRYPKNSSVHRVVHGSSPYAPLPPSDAAPGWPASRVRAFALRFDPICTVMNIELLQFYYSDNLYLDTVEVQS